MWTWRHICRYLLELIKMWLCAHYSPAFSLMNWISCQTKVEEKLFVFSNLESFIMFEKLETFLFQVLHTTENAKRAKWKTHIHSHIQTRQNFSSLSHFFFRLNFDIMKVASLKVERRLECYFLSNIICCRSSSTLNVWKSGCYRIYWMKKKKKNISWKKIGEYSIKKYYWEHISIKRFADENKLFVKNDFAD